MTTAIQHRGPDDAGLLLSSQLPLEQSSTQCALGHRRLSIIDIGGGHQPLGNEDGTIWTVFNGEIYNYRELREELIGRGHRFATSSDTEVIVHLYEEMGERCVEKMRGMFAFAVWDHRRGRVLLARDRLGQKPLVYREEESRLLFASELKAILQVPGVPRKVSPQSIDLYLTYQYVPHPHSIFEGYSKLPPAHVAIWESGTLTVQRYWTPPYNEPPGPPLPVDRWQNELRETLTEAVRLRLRSDVPLGAFLSGGVDSTIIAGLMQSLSDRAIHTFSIGFPEKEYDERHYARQAAALLKTDHHEFVVEPSALGMLPELIWHFDEPFSDSSAIPTMYLSEVTRQFVTVALSGDGGDELFAGYTRYQAVSLAGQFDSMPSWMKSVLGWKLWQQIPTSTTQRGLGRRAKRFIEALSQSPERRYLRWIGIFDAQLRSQLYTPEFRHQLEGFDSSDFLLDAYALCPNRDFVTRTTAVDVQTYLPCDILTKVDVSSMSVALEARSPFLDHRVVELAARMPIELKFERGRGKKILVDTFKDLLPQDIQTRPKMGFGVPIDHWMRNEYRQFISELLLSDRALERGIFQRKTVERLIQDHMTRRWDHAYRLWNLLCLELWHRMFVDGPVPTGPQGDLLERCGAVTSSRHGS